MANGSRQMRSTALYSINFPSRNQSLHYQTWFGYISWLVLRLCWLLMRKKLYGLTLPMIFLRHSRFRKPPWDYPKLATTYIIWGAISSLLLGSSNTRFPSCPAPPMCGCSTSWVGCAQLFLMARN